jgi:peptidoglycan-associated lipoprotein
MSLSRRILVVVPVVVGALVLAGCVRSGGSTLAATPAPPSGLASAFADGSASPSPTGPAARGRQGFSPADYRRVDGIKAVYFDFDRADLRADDLPILDRNAAWMLENRGYAILIQGYADERGTAEYNLALGDKRAKSAMNYLVSKGVSANRFAVLSYGAEHALCAEHTETCWAKNRRAEFLVKPE